MFFIFIMMYFSLLNKKSILSILLNMEMIMIMVLMLIKISFSKVIFITIMVFMVSEAVLGLTLCVKFTFSFFSIKSKFLNLSLY